LNLSGKLSSEKLTLDQLKTGNNQSSNTFSKKNTFNNKGSESSLKGKITNTKENHSKELESLVENKQSEFACCTVNNVAEIQEKLVKYCEESNVNMKDIGNAKFECEKENYTVGLEFTNARGMKFLKIYLVRGNEQSAKELMKAFLNLVL